MSCAANIPKDKREESDGTRETSSTIDLVAETKRLEASFSERVADNYDFLQAEGRSVFYRTPKRGVRHFTPSTGVTLKTSEVASTDIAVAENFLAAVTVEGGKVRYHIYDSAQGLALSQVHSVAAPTDEQRWWAFHVTNDGLYYVTTGEHTSLMFVKHGTTTPMAVVDIEQEANVAVDVFEEFLIDGKTFVFTESSRLWLYTIGSHEPAVWLNRDGSPVAGKVASSSDAVYFATERSIYRYKFGANSPEDLSDVIKKITFNVHPDYPRAHLPDGKDFAIYSDRFVYLGNLGVYELNFATNELRTLLLGYSQDGRIDYRNLQFTSDGQLFLFRYESSNSTMGLSPEIVRISPTSLGFKTE